ncbi:hypothetical protein CA13_11150 [Planctomycetes bacterium CA13]|uniref:Uncharacterized protein n=1 Tax=Novipirellula herctigrandis TaxID=2527986 RepID=A0A5C5YXC2_9BACT|nr:hypothetical protein CA13_11150 [Planctomycetes bacterium CA13]
MMAFLIRCPPSPLFVGLEQPIPIASLYAHTEWNSAILYVAVSQCDFLNAALIAACVMIPVNATNTFLQDDTDIGLKETHLQWLQSDSTSGVVIDQTIGDFHFRNNNDN